MTMNRLQMHPHLWPVFVKRPQPEYPTLSEMFMFWRFRLVTLTSDIAAMNLKLESMALQ